MRRRIKNTLPWLLLLSIGLRSIAAPGYMFSNLDSEGNLALGLTWCSGLNNVNNDTQHHRDENGPVNQTNNNEHFTAVCGLLAGSTNFIENNINYSDGFVLLDYCHLQIEYDDPTYNYLYRSNHSTRAPPFLIIV